MQRNISIDLLRVICCFLVIGIHTTPNFSTVAHGEYSYTLQFQSVLMSSVVRVSLPLFFIISGYFLLNSNISNLKEWYIKRLSTLLIPFFIYSFIQFYILKWDSNVSMEMFAAYFKLLIKSQTSISIHFWYVYVLLGIYIITPAISIILKNIESTNAIKTIIFILALNSYNLYSQFIPFLSEIKKILAFPNIGIWVSYYIIGGMLARVKLTNIKVAWVVLALLVTMVVVYLNEKTSLLLYPYDLGTNMAIYASLVLLFFRGNVTVNSPILIATISFLSKYTYGIFLIHFTVLVLFNRKTQIPFICEPLVLKILFVSACTFIISLIISIVIDNLVSNRIVKIINR